MNFSMSESQKQWRDRVVAFMDKHVYPAVEQYDAQQAQGDRWKVIPVIEELKAKAKAEGLWNLFLPPSPDHDEGDYHGAGLTNLDYALCAEEMGRVDFGSEVFNCSAPDTGNMEVLHRYGSKAQKEKWLKPLLRGEIRSAFLMTEPAVASSDATNIETAIVKDGESYLINGRKWWSSGAGDPRCKIAIVMGKTDPKAATHAQQSQILVPLGAPGVKIVRMLPVFGFDDAPHGHAEIILENVARAGREPASGRRAGFRDCSGPTRARPHPPLHAHDRCGRGGAGEDGKAAAIAHRFRQAHLRPLGMEQRVAEARIDIEMTRLLCLKAADMMDTVGNKAARLEIAMIKVAAPRAALRVIDDAIQAWGGAGVTTDAGLGARYAHIRSMRLFDGPDEVHNRTIAKLEFAKYTNR